MNIYIYIYNLPLLRKWNKEIQIFNWHYKISLFDGTAYILHNHVYHCYICLRFLLHKCLQNQATISIYCVLDIIFQFMGNWLPLRQTYLSISIRKWAVLINADTSESNWKCRYLTTQYHITLHKEKLDLLWCCMIYCSAGLHIFRRSCSVASVSRLQIIHIVVWSFVLRKFWSLMKGVYWHDSFNYLNYLFNSQR